MHIRTLALILALPAIAGAQGIIMPRCPTPRGDAPRVECIPSQPQIVRTRSDVRVELRDHVLRYEVEERFVNRGGRVGEADYVFPLPGGAAFRDLQLSIDGEMVSGETLSATEARRIYEDIVRRRRDPALVEWMGHGMLRTRIFPIEPGQERRIIVRFERVAPREGDAIRVDYFRGSAHVEDASRRTVGSSRISGRSSLTLTYRAGGELGEAYSPTHELDVERDDAVRRVHVRDGGPDITVLVAIRRPTTPSIALLANATGNGPGFALITVTPPAQLASDRLPRDVTFVIDVSGSMSGHKIEQARAAGRQLLRTLTPQDRFRLIDFATDVRTFRDEFVFATDANVRDALRYLDDLDAEGGTNIAGALDEALRRGATADDTARLPLVLFMTDGEPTIGERNPASIAQRAAKRRGDARVFSFGIGQDVNVGLIEQLALEGRGTASFVRPNESVERAVGLLASRLRQPLLTDVRVSVEGDVRLSRTYPSGPQDVFAGQDLVLLARYDGHGSARIVVEGRSAGRAVHWVSERVFPDRERENAFVPRLWATQRLGWLAAEKRRAGGSREIDDEIRELGERYGIPTEFTSYLVREPGDLASAPPRPVPQRRGLTDGKGASAPAMAPAARAEAEFEAARLASQRRAAKSLVATDVVTSAAGGEEMKRGGTHLFQRDGERWVDVRMKSELRVYQVRAYSRGYFALLERIPELREALAVGEQVLVAGAGVAIEVSERGGELSEDDVNAIVSRW